MLRLQCAKDLVQACSQSNFPGLAWVAWRLALNSPHSKREMYHDVLQSAYCNAYVNNFQTKSRKEDQMKGMCQEPPTILHLQFYTCSSLLSSLQFLICSCVAWLCRHIFPLYDPALALPTPKNSGFDPALLFYVNCWKSTCMSKSKKDVALSMSGGLERVNDMFSVFKSLLERTAWHYSAIISLLLQWMLQYTPCQTESSLFVCAV